MMFVSFFFLTRYFQLVQGRTALSAALLILPTSAAMMVGAPISGVLVKRVGPRALISASMLLMTTGILMLTQVEVDTSTSYVIAALAAFGLAAGLGMAPLTDTVMAAVPVDDAGIGSAVNDVTCELGGALGIALIGSLVNGWYRGNIDAMLAASQLPAEMAPTLTTTANLAFVDAMTNGVLRVGGDPARDARGGADDGADTDPRDAGHARGVRVGLGARDHSARGWRRATRPDAGAHRRVALLVTGASRGRAGHRARLSCVRMVRLAG
jgi:hypothetical protein